MSRRARAEAPDRSAGSVLHTSRSAGYDRRLIVPPRGWAGPLIIEAVSSARRQARTARAGRRGPAAGTIVSSNTSGIPIASIAEGRGDECLCQWLGTLFNRRDTFASSRSFRPRTPTSGLSHAFGCRRRRQVRRLQHAQLHRQPDRPVRPVILHELESGEFAIEGSGSPDRVGCRRAQFLTLASPASTCSTRRRQSAERLPGSRAVSCRPRGGLIAQGGWERNAPGVYKRRMPS